MHSSPASQPGRCPARPRCARWKSSRSWKTGAAAFMRAPSATSISPATWTSASRSARWSSKTAAPTCRPGPASWRTPIRRRSTKKPRTRRGPCSRRSNWRRRDYRYESFPPGGRLMVLVIDNYDSCTYNLVQYLGELGADIRVRRNDEVTIGEAEAMAPEQILISPGPGRPEAAGVSVDIIRHFAPSTPILGVCLGHQAIGVVYGGTVCRAATPMHGKTSTIVHDGKGLFLGINEPFQAGRYHSLVISTEHIPDE